MIFQAMDIALAGLALFGHFALCIAAINRLHAVGLSRPYLRVIDLLWSLLVIGTPLFVAMRVTAWSHVSGNRPATLALSSLLDGLALACLLVGVLAAGYTLLAIARQRRIAPQSVHLARNHTRQIDVGQVLGHPPIGGLATRLAARLPGNEILRLSIHQKYLSLPLLPAALDGLSIAHISDLHFTGQLTPDFFHEVVRQSNQLDPDLVAITGDIIDESACLRWLPEILGQLTSRHGIYFVLGNHDQKIKQADQVVRQALTDVGFVNLGGRWELIQIDGWPVLLAGNELPWFGPAADMSRCPTSDGDRRPLRIALSHSPDQLPWARRHNVDLLLAGHTHGGQCRLPWIGPILCPSRYGVRYASGVFYEPPTLMHVSRGISGTRPLRYRCPPELPRLVLQGETA
jgi:predicted MPP superfamily phosphohydrolase